MKRWIHSAIDIRREIEQANFTKGRIEGLKDTIWEVSEQDAKDLAGLGHYNKMLSFKGSNPVIKVEYAPDYYAEKAKAKGFDTLFLVTYKNGWKNLQGWRDGCYEYYASPRSLNS